MNILEYENYQEKIPHGNPLFPYITYPCSIPLDFSRVPLHWHDEMEIIYIKKGTGAITVDFKSYVVTEGTIALILPGRLHSIEQYMQESSRDLPAMRRLPPALTPTMKSAGRTRPAISSLSRVSSLCFFTFYSANAS